MARLGAVVLLGAIRLHQVSGYTTDLMECGSPSNPKFTEGYECTGCAFTAVDINTFNILKNDKGCVAGLSGMYAGSSAAKGYHCLTVKEAGDGTVSCTVHKACGATNVTDKKTKSCIYTMGGFSGIDDKAKCPADEVCNGGATSTSAASKSSASMIILLGVFLTVASGYVTDLTECGSPSNPKFTEGYECTGCAFTAVDMNTFNILKSDKGCVAGLSGMYAGSSAAKGYHCLTVKEAGDGTVSCTVHKACGAANVTDKKTKSCIYTMGGFSGIDDKAKCPADEVCNGGATSSSASAKLSTSIVLVSIVLCAITKYLQ